MRKFLLLFSLLLLVLFLFQDYFIFKFIMRLSEDLFEDNAIRKVYDYPKRGYVYDQKWQTLGCQSTILRCYGYSQRSRTFGYSLNFVHLLKINKEDFIKTYNKAYHYSPQITIGFCISFIKRRLCLSSGKNAKI